TRFRPLRDAPRSDLIVAGRLASPGSLAAIDPAGQAIDQLGSLLARALDADVTRANRTQQGREQDRSRDHRSTKQNRHGTYGDGAFRRAGTITLVLVLSLY